MIHGPVPEALELRVDLKIDQRGLSLGSLRVNMNYRPAYASQSSAPPEILDADPLSARETPK